MGRRFQRFQMVDGSEVPYSLRAKPDGTYLVQFRGRDGKYQRINTYKADENSAVVEAARAIVKAFRGTPKTEAPTGQTWADLREALRINLTCNNNRVATFKSYDKAVRAVAETLPKTKGPGDITPDLAEQFKAKWISTPYKKTKAKGAKTYQRSHIALNSLLRTLRSVWSKWLRPRPAVNPWQHVDYAPVDRHRPQAPAEDAVDQFFAWLRDRYGDWRLPEAFWKIKAVTGCRLDDLCQLWSRQFDGGSIRFEADQTKTRTGRSFPLPADVAELVESVRGPATGRLWLNYPKGLARHHKRAGLANHRAGDHFSPVALYWWAQAELKDFTRKTGVHLRSHAFRRRAVTLLYRSGKSVDRVADLLGMSRQNVLASYLDRADAVSAEEFAEAADLLSPK